MKIILVIFLVCVSFLVIFFGIGGVVDHLNKYPLLVCEDNYPCYNDAMKNISEKCGVKGDEPLWTTAMQKISDCIDRLEKH